MTPELRMAELREDWFSQGIEPPFEVRIGINTGRFRNRRETCGLAGGIRSLKRQSWELSSLLLRQCVRLTP